jgi:molybdate transport repressor ModE-like protein
MKTTEIKYKIWIEKDGDIIIGMGREKLLREIEKTGSIKKASENIGISYKKAIEYIKAMEKRTGKKIVETFRGGANKGGAKLTPFAKKLLKDFEEILKRFEKLKSSLENEKYI